ncbi:MAG: SLC13 family permease [Geminicoccaceae bacterium]|nr:SLC13 family permease [Geminicoccaceae bacterium]
MTFDQGLLFGLLLVVLVLLVWGRWRYDLVAFGALVVAVSVGLVPADRAFEGFGHPAVVIIALVLIVSRGLANSGAVDLIANRIVDAGRSLFGHILRMAGVAAALSAVMNNVAALALLMPVDLQAAKGAGRSPALSLMPLSFASILGGLVTLIGTPPNIIIGQFREDALGEPFRMFDFAPVGLVIAATGVVFITLIGWRLIPAARGEHDVPGELFELETYVAEIKVKDGSKAIDQRVDELAKAAAEHDTAILGLIRYGQRLAGSARRVVVKADDVLVVQGGPEALDKLVGELGLDYPGTDRDDSPLKGQDLELVEVVVPQNALIENRSAAGVGLLERHAVSLIGVSRQGRRFRQRVGELTIRAGDILLLLGPAERLPAIVQWLGALPLAPRGLQVSSPGRAGLAVSIFAGAILLASFGLLPLAAALAGVVVLMVLSGIVTLRQVYDSVEWPVIVLLAALIPIGEAMETTGATSLIANAVLIASSGYGPVAVLTILMILTMTLSDVLNNTATAVIAAPIAIDIAARLGVDPDPFLMAVAVAASCAFLTPIGHKNNTLIMGPGGYAFGDYWRMGLPLEILIVAVGVPMILLVWPL